jgi:Zn-dependent metalloprotease
MVTGGTYFDVLTSIDVAHEIGHAVCENNKLSVPKESGAMNEASLIFGSLYRILRSTWKIYLVNWRT